MHVNERWPLPVLTRTKLSFISLLDPYPPRFTSCPAEIYALQDENITWQDPEVADNVGIYRIKANGDEIRDRVLQVGTYQVSYTVWDFDQNQAICAFLVRVFDRGKSTGVAQLVKN